MNNYPQRHHRSFKIKFAQPFRDDKLAFVESVLTAMNASRFAPNRPFQLIATQATEPDSTVSVFHYRKRAGLVPAYGDQPSMPVLERLIRVDLEASRTLNSPASQTRAPESSLTASGPLPLLGIAQRSLSNGQPPGHGPPSLPLPLGNGIATTNCLGFSPMSVWAKAPIVFPDHYPFAKANGNPKRADSAKPKIH